ncbi:carboxypeptidase-like regulatory domain-containing protein [Phocaeicola sartorii]|jgi:hypothetical protein BACCOPRO_02277|uniref:Uncharacterized protein n=1 Tax=Phocaeicola sartorii TaxID=671267 RepID=R9I625_9BACT|nr:carboxypeptidase-like regulatory domain-containing protein [Phocaeicola sartorii]EOS11713.1 hypothetical protein C802_02825 [Phocaeicola sartorii]MCR1845498.1 carboxypeptidase-like regulatory domain-containing protein [Phocaeicola sartorii]NBH67475.1 TonB-dependent receptor [Phocaeicola sartorii]NUL00860.1 carboxypeptidase-like regulatory domain-containing protein [Phocaeicola sartorii]
MNSLRFIVALCISLFFIEARTQSIVKGKIKNAISQGVSYATIRILQKDSTYVQGASSDSMGCYKFVNVKQGRYLLAVSSIGYTSEIYPFDVNGTNDKVLPDIILTDNNIVLNEVVVKGQSFIRQKDRVLIVPDRQQMQHSHTGYDLLYNLMIPNIEVDRRKGSVSTLGGSVTLYVNGRKADYREVKNLRPKNIEKIEYYDAPTGKYAGDIASINYIVKEQQTGGYVSLDADQTIGYLKGDYNAAVKVAHGNTSYTLFAGHAMQQYENDDNNKLEIFCFSDNPFTKNSFTDLERIKTNQQYAQLNILNRNKMRTLGAKISLIHNDIPDNIQSCHFKYSGYNETAKSKNLTNQSSLMPTVELYGSFQLKENQWLECTLSGTCTNNDYNRSYEESAFLSSTNVKEKLYTLDPSLKYTVSMKHHNSLTVQVQHSHKVTSSTYLGDYHSWQHLWSGETLFFLSYNQRLNKKVFIDGRVGMSSLQYRLHGHDKIAYVTPRGNILLGYQMSDNQQLYWGASIGNAYPEINTINSAEQNIDIFHIKRGNPDLDKINMYMTSASYSLQFGRFNLFGIFMYSSEINAALPAYYIENDKILETFRSDGDYHLFRSGLDLSWKATNAFRLRLSGRWQYGMIKGFTNESQNSVYGKLNVTYYWKNLTLSLYAQTQSRELTEVGVYEWQDGRYGGALSWNHNNWAIEVGTNNPFLTNNETRYYLNSNVYSYSNHIYNRVNQQTGYIKVAYTFDFGKKMSKDQKNISTTINSAILKAE